MTNNQLLMLSAMMEYVAIPELIARIKEDEGVSISRAGAYTTCDRLEDSGMLKSKVRDYKNPSGRVVRRRFVCITGKGKRALDDAMAARNAAARLAFGGA